MTTLGLRPTSKGYTYIEELCTSQELHDQRGGDNGRDTELHEGAPVTGQDHTDPVERVSRVRGHDAKQGDLRSTVYINDVDSNKS